MKSRGKKTVKLPSRSARKLRTAIRNPVKPAAKESARKRRTIKSTVPPQFRELKQLAAANDPRFWTLRREFRDYLYTLPEEEVEPFLEGLGEPYLGYLVMAMVQERGQKKSARLRRISESA